MSRANDMAYPVDSTVETPKNTVQHGLTIREHFAAMAMMGSSAYSLTKERDPKTIAAEAVKYADALIAELAKATP